MHLSPKGLFALEDSGGQNAAHEDDMGAPPDLQYGSAYVFKGT